MRIAWTARRSNQSILKEINPEYLLEGLMLKPKYFSQLMQKVKSLAKTLMLEKIEGRRRRGQQRMRWLDGITDSMDEFEQAPGDDEGQGSLVCCSPWGIKELDMTERLTSSKFPCHLTHCHVAAIHNIHFPCQKSKMCVPAPAILSTFLPTELGEGKEEGKPLFSLGIIYFRSTHFLLSKI